MRSYWQRFVNITWTMIILEILQYNVENVAITFMMIIFKIVTYWIGQLYNCTNEYCNSVLPKTSYLRKLLEDFYTMWYYNFWIFFVINKQIEMRFWRAK